MAFLSMIPGGDPDLVTYLTQLLRTNKPDQQNNTFWFPTPENPGNTEDHTPIQTRILTELRELQRREKLNPKDNIESRTEFLKRFDWTDTLLTETEKQAVEDILVLKTWMTLELQPITLRISPGTFGQSSSAFAMQD